MKAPKEIQFTLKLNTKAFMRELKVCGRKIKTYRQSMRKFQREIAKSIAASKKRTK
jgi:hypothetical protein